jgi:tetratricopeptide (TPR) repeat protein
VELEVFLELYDLYEAAGYPYRAKMIRTGRKILKIDPHNSRIALRLWRFYYHEAEDYESALVFLEKAVKADPALPEDVKIGSALNTLRRYVRIFNTGEVDHGMISVDVKDAD